MANPISAKKIKVTFIDGYEIIEPYNDAILKVEILPDELPPFTKELEALLNRHSKENDSDTPDFILAEYLIKCLDAYEIAIEKRDKWKNG